MDRRGFLKLLGMAAPAIAVAPTYFFAPSGGWNFSAEGLALPNTSILTPEKEALRILMRNLKFTAALNRQFDESFGETMKIGNMLHIKAPPRYAIAR